MKKLFVLFSILLVFGAVSCNIGMGNSVDLEAPTIEITWPSNNGYVPKSFVITGIASDNLAITDIEVQYTYAKTEGAEKVTELKHTNTKNRKNGEWSCQLDFPFDQEVAITVYAKDRMKNESIDSSDSILVVVDSESPKASSISITRNSGFTTSTAKIEKFLGEDGREAKRNESENKDSFQNESIILSSKIEETYEIKEVYLDLYEIKDYVSKDSYTKEVLKEKIPIRDTVLNLFNPEFEVTQEMLTSYNSSLATGVHYIMPVIVVEDAAGNKSVQNNSDVPFVFAWEAEYDVPKASFPLYYYDGRLKFPQETSLPVMIFDDDGLKSFSWELISVGGGINREGEEDISNKNLRDHSVEIPTGIVAGKWDSILPDGDYKLTIRVTDQILGDNSHSEKTFELSDIPVKITNPDAPQINVTEPAANKTPALVSQQYFSVIGQVTDNLPVKDIAIAWCIGGDAKQAEKFFETYDFKDKSSAPVNDSEYNLKVWNIGRKGDAIATEKNGAIVAYINNFETQFDIYEDFKDLSGNLVNKQKVFVIVARDTTENITTETLTLSAFNSLPKFEVSVAKGTDPYETETRSAVSIAPGNAVKVKIKPFGDYPIESFSVSIDGGTSIDCSNKISGGYEIEITTTTAGTNKAIEYSAKDKLGNENSGSFKIQFEELPTLSGVICNQVGTQIKKNGVLTVQVTFDRGVEVTGTPTLVFDCYKNEADTTKAGTMALDYASGSNSSSLTFKKTITETVEYKKLVLVADGDGNWIQGGTIKKGDLIAKRNSKLTDADKEFKLTIDTKDPSFDDFTGQRSGATANFTKTNGTVSITLNFSEPVTAQNGNITIYRKGSEDLGSADHTWHIPAVISADVFEKIWNNSSVDNRVILCGSSTSTSTPGPDAYGEPTIVSAGPYKMYTNGLKLNDKAIYQYIVDGGNAVSSKGKGDNKEKIIHAENTVMVPDITTKYVLDWQYDTSDFTSDDVKDIRAALEAVNYHKTTIPLSRLNLTNSNTATLQINDSDFIDGIREGVEYIMEIPADSFVDEVLNKTTEKTYTFSVGKTATPVIRVNRWSTNSNLQLDPYHADETDENFLKAGVKIDCETPGANIRYQVTTLTVNSTNSTTDNSQNNVYPPDYKPEPVDTVEAVTKNNQTAEFNNLAVLTVGTPSFDKKPYNFVREDSIDYSDVFYVGDNSITTGQRIYIAAQAKTPSAKIADLQDSDNAYEGAFKTIFYHRNPHCESSWAGNAYKGLYKGDNFKIFAVQTPEGVSYTAGWPITMRQHWHETTTEVGTRDGYKIATKKAAGGNYDYIFVSWELISDDLFTFTSVAYNFQEVIDSLATYGAMIWVYSLQMHGAY